MALEELERRLVRKGTEYIFLRPGITLCLFYAEPACTLGPAVADIFEKYMAFIPAGALQTYLAADGSWKKMDKRVLNKTLSALRSIGAIDFAEVHFGEEPAANVGKYGVHFKASPLQDTFYPRETCVLYLEFPVELPEPDALVEFVKSVASVRECDSGHCGYAFKNLQMTFRHQAFDEIGKLAMRYIGFDVSNDQVRRHARGCVCNVSWLNLFGRGILSQLGGPTKVQQELSDAMELGEVGPGIIVRSAELPMVGDRNRGATDVGPLRRLAKITRPLRVEVANLGPDDPSFAEHWLSRFDE
jgi:hypothetical protein